MSHQQQNHHRGGAYQQPYGGRGQNFESILSQQVIDMHKGGILTAQMTPDQQQMCKTVPPSSAKAFELRQQELAFSPPQQLDGNNPSPSFNQGSTYDEKQVYNFPQNPSNNIMVQDHQQMNSQQLLQPFQEENNLENEQQLKSNNNERGQTTYDKQSLRKQQQNHLQQVQYRRQNTEAISAGRQGYTHEANDDLISADYDQQAQSTNEEQKNQHFYNQANGQYLSTFGDFPSDDPNMNNHQQNTDRSSRMANLGSDANILTTQEKQMILQKRKNEMLQGRGGYNSKKVNQSSALIKQLDLSKIEKSTPCLSPNSQTRTHGDIYIKSPMRGSNATTPRGITYKVHSLHDQIRQQNTSTISKNTNQLSKSSRIMKKKPSILGHNNESDPTQDGQVFSMVSYDCHGHAKETKAYNISDYRTSCRTCKDMETEAYEKLTTKKTYKRGSLLNQPNSGFTKIGTKTKTTSYASNLRPMKPSLNVEKAQKLLADTKGKVASVPRYNVTQLKHSSLEQLIKIILLLQDENDRLRAELEKMRIKIQMTDKKSAQIGQLKSTIKLNKASLENARQALRDGYKMIMFISHLVEEILQAFRLPQKKQQLVLPKLLSKLKVLLEGHYQPTSRGAKTDRLGRTQVLDDLNNESMITSSMPMGSIKEQLENLITQTGFEAHKAEALLHDNTDQDRKHIEEYYDSVQNKLNKEKSEFQNHIQRQHQDEITDLKNAEANVNEQLEQYQKRIVELEQAADAMAREIRELRIRLEQESDKNNDMDLQNRQQAQRIEALNEKISDDEKLIDEFKKKVQSQARENTDLFEENKRYVEQIVTMRSRMEELKDIENLNLDRMSIAPRLAALKQSEQEFQQKQQEYEAKIDELRKLKESNRGLNQTNSELQAKIDQLEGRIDNFKEDAKQIPKLEKDKKSLTDKITDLQVQLQDTRYEKNGLLEQLKVKEGFEELHGVVAKISQMIIKREDVTFSEREQSVFKELFGNQVIDALKDCKKDDSVKKSLFSERQSHGVDRDTFRLNDSRHNDELMNQMVNNSGIGMGSSQHNRRPSLGSRSAKNDDYQNKQMTPRGEFKTKPPRPQNDVIKISVESLDDKNHNPPNQNRFRRRSTLQQIRRYNTVDDNSTLGVNYEETKEKSHNNISFDDTKSHKSKKSKQRRLSKRNKSEMPMCINCLSNTLDVSKDNLLKGVPAEEDVLSAPEKINETKAKEVEDVVIRPPAKKIIQNVYYGDEDLLQMLHLQASYIEETLVNE